MIVSEFDRSLIFRELRQCLPVTLRIIIALGANKGVDSLFEAHVLIELFDLLKILALQPSAKYTLP